MVNQPQGSEQSERSKVEQKRDGLRDVDVSPLHGQLQRALRNGEPEDDIAEAFEPARETALARCQRRFEGTVMDGMRLDREAP